MKELLITICARGGSKGIPGKNIKVLNGVPLLHYSLRFAQHISKKFNADIQISTDSEEILNSAKELNYLTDYRRPDVLATDSAGKIPAIEDALKYAEELNNCQYKYVLDLDVTSPLRTIDDIEKALAKLKGNEKAVNIFSVSPAARNPYFNMVEEGDNGFVKLVKSSGEVKSRQEAPKVYDMNASFYIYRRTYFTEGYGISTTPYSMAYVMEHTCFDLDEPIDFKIMELLLKDKSISIEL